MRAAVAYRSIRPHATLDQFTIFMNKHFAKGVLVKKNDAAELYEKYGPDKFNLADRGYLAHVHPLELWMLNYREQHPKANLKELAAQLEILEKGTAGRPWIAGVNFSIADICLGPVIDRALAFPVTLPAIPGVRAWRDKLVARDAYKKTKA